MFLEQQYLQLETSQVTKFVERIIDKALKQGKAGTLKVVASFNFEYVMIKLPFSSHTPFRGPGAAIRGLQRSLQQL